MYDVLDVSRYVINYSNEKGYGVSNLKLQKLLYFIQAYFLVEMGVQCFKQPIQAWNFGPVVPEAYHEFKIFGCADIPTINKYTSVDLDGGKLKITSKTFSIYSINAEHRSAIDRIIDHFKDHAASDLVYITHNQKPWKDAFKKGQNTEISIESIRSYFV